MFSLLIIPVLVAGFFACHIHPVHYYKLHRYEGQYLYLKCAELGIGCFALSVILIYIINKFCPFILVSTTTELSNTINYIGLSGRNASIENSLFIIISAITFFSAYILKLLGFLILFIRFKTLDSNKVKIYVITKLMQENPRDELMFDLSFKLDQYAMLTLNDRKVYVGKVINIGEPTETRGMNEDILIMPIISGYRHQDTLEVSFTTFYSDIDDDIYLSLRQDNILSITEFNFDAYKQWNNAKNSKHWAGVESGMFWGSGE